MVLPKRLLVVLTSLLFVRITTPREAEAWLPPAAARQKVYQQVSPDDLDAFVAPIALYPDALLAQILGASTADGGARKYVGEGNMTGGFAF